MANAVDEVKEKANFILKNNGGEGAVRELCEMVVKARK